MRLGITGASGFIGGVLGTRAAARGWRVTAFSRTPGRTTLPWADEVRALDDDPDVGDLDALVHLAGESILGLWTPAKKRRLRDSRVDVTRQLVKAMGTCKASPRVLLSASGTGFYGDRGDARLIETDSPGDTFLSAICVDWEAEANEAAAYGARVVTLRTGFVLGGQGGAFPLLRTAFGLGLGGRLGSGAQFMPWIHIDDEVEMILWAIENPAIQGALNVTAPTPATNAELTTELASVLRRPAFLHAPTLAMQLLPGGFGSALMESQRAIPAKAESAGFSFRYPELREALVALLQRDHASG